MTTKADDSPVILWFRRDLRLADNPALTHAVETGRPVIPVYILDQGAATPMGGASLWWLDKSLRALDAALSALGSRLILRRSDSEAELRRLIREAGAGTVFLNRRFEPDAFARDADIAHGLQAEGVTCKGWNGTLLARPGSVLNGSGLPYKVFTPFHRALLATAVAPPPAPAPDSLRTPTGLASDNINTWDLHPRRPDWSGGFDWTPGEAGAEAALAAFLSRGLKSYSLGRDIPAEPATSRLSPHLHFGEISPWRAIGAARAAAAEGRVPAPEVDKFVAEIGWREFAHHLLYHFPHTPGEPLRAEYSRFPWADDAAQLEAWRRGRTGVPLVDAGMRELWTTGWMHNRVRMVVGSFLVKNLRLHWLEGARWFWDTLVDADLAANTLGWQWTAGCGADAAPYFRVFNPVSQGLKFDPTGDYVRRWVPELARLSGGDIHAPWEARPETLQRAGIVLGRDYPLPIVDLKRSREAALTAWQTLRAPRPAAT